MKHPPIRIVIVDDHEVVRRGLRALLASDRAFRIVGEAGTAAEAVGLAERLRPHLVLLDMKLPDASGAETCRQVLAASPQSHVLILTSFSDEAMVVSAVQNGARGYVLKDVRTDDLLQAIRTVAGGRGYLDPCIAQRTFRWLRTHAQGDALTKPAKHLSPQERVIMPLLAEGRTNKEIASTLNLSDKTVRNYLANIFDKLQVKRRTEAVAWFIKESQSSCTGQPPN